MQGKVKIAVGLLLVVTAPLTAVGLWNLQLEYCRVYMDGGVEVFGCLGYAGVYTMIITAGVSLQAIVGAIFLVLGIRGSKERE